VIVSWARGAQDTITLVFGTSLIVSCAPGAGLEGHSTGLFVEKRARRRFSRKEMFD